MKKLLVIGAGYLQSFVIRRAAQMGYEVLAVDADPAAPGFAFAGKSAVINIVDKEACLNYARKEKIDGVMTAATDYGVLTAAHIAQALGLPGLREETARLIKNKYLTQQRLISCHVDDTCQALEVKNDTDLEAIKNTLQYPVMVKPCDGSGSRGTARVDGPEGLKNACRNAMAASLIGRALIETFVTGEEYGAESLVTGGKVHVMAIMKKWMTQAPYYAELGHAIPSGLIPEVESRARECVQKAIEALGVTSGCVNMDMIITPEGRVHIVDIGARMGGNMIGPCIIPYGTGIDYVAAAIKTALGEEADMTPREHGCVVTKFLAFSDGQVGALPDMGLIEKECKVEIYHHMKAGQQVHAYHTNLDGLGYIVARADSLQEGRDRVEKAYGRIEREAFHSSAGEIN